MIHRIARTIAIALSLAVVGAACVSTSSSDQSAPQAVAPASGSMDHSSMASGSDTIDAGASGLQQGLTDLLDSHVYLASIAISTGLNAGLDSKEFKAAAATLDQNSQDLASAVASVYGNDAGKQFLALWRKHIGFFVEYTQGKATGNDKMAQKALKELDSYRKDFGAFIESATGGELSADAVAKSLQMHVNALIDAIDLAVAGKTDVFDAIYTAAHVHMPETATALAGGIAAQMPDTFPTS
jgi:hypothetical protein